MNGVLRAEQTVFIDSRTNKDLILRSRIFKGRTRAGIAGRVGVIHNEGFTAFGIRRRFLKHGRVPQGIRR